MSNVYKPIVSPVISRCLLAEKEQHLGYHIPDHYKEWKHRYSRKYKYAMKNGWLVDNGDGKTHRPTAGLISLTKKEIYKAVKRSKTPAGHIPVGTLSFHRFIQRTGFDPSKIKTSSQYLNHVSVTQQIDLFKQIGFELLPNKPVTPQPHVIQLTIDAKPNTLQFILKDRSKRQ